MINKLLKYSKYIIYTIIAAIISFFLFVFNFNNQEKGIVKETTFGDIESQKAEAAHTDTRRTHGDDADGGN